MNGLFNCAQVFKKLLHKEFLLTLENNQVIKIVFKKRHFFHLVGLHKLKDIAGFNHNKTDIFTKILDGEITDYHIQKSFYYKKIEDRIKYFNIIPDLLNSKIIIDFDSRLLPNTELKNTKYILYKRQPFGYLHLTIGYKANELYPETFMVENSKRYISGQQLLNVIDVKVINIRTKKSKSRKMV